MKRYGRLFPLWRRRDPWPVFSAMVFVLIFTAGLACPGWAQDRVHSVYFEGTDYELNVYRIEGKEPGNTILLVGGIQGDEPGGFLSVDHYADLSLAKGNLIVVPRANFQSILHNQREINEDMNRKFADDRKINYETEIVTILKKLISESDCLLNLHDGSGFFSETWQGSQRNPMRFGQSIIADAEVYPHGAKGHPLELGRMARAVCAKINAQIKDPRHYFHFNNHRTLEKNTRHPEQRKSATFYALTHLGIPAFGIETSKSLPLIDKVREHNMAVNAFMALFDVIPETPGLNIKPPHLDYIVIAVNDSPPVVLKGRQTLHLHAGDRIRISHIEANYERGLTADILGLGTLNDVRKTFVIQKSTRIVVRKDYYPCGSIDIDVGETRSVVAGMRVTDEAPLQNDLFFRVERNGQALIIPNNGHLPLIAGDRFQVRDVITGMADPALIKVNVKGFVGDRSTNTGEDRGFVIDSGTDFMKRFSLHQHGRQYQAVVTASGKTLGRMVIDLEPPRLDDVVLGYARGEFRAFYPGQTALIDPRHPPILTEIHTSVAGNDGIRAELRIRGRGAVAVAEKAPVRLTAGEAGTLVVYRRQLVLGHLDLKAAGEAIREARKQ